MPSRVFVAMPFADEFWPVWKAIKAAVEAAGGEPRRVDLLAHVPNIHEAIFDEIATCDAVIGDLSPDKNPGVANQNVVYEVAHAGAIGKPVLILSQSADSLAFDTRVKQAIIYTNTEVGREILTERLCDACCAALTTAGATVTAAASAPAPAVASSPSPPSDPVVDGFTVLGRKEFSCKNNVEGKREFTVPVYRCDAFTEALGISPSRIGEAVDTEFVLLPPPGHDGRFRMGSKEYSDEQPVHPVTIRRPFLIARTAVSQRVYEAIGGDHGSFDWPGAMQPANEVSWKDVTAWCEKVRLRLPSEAEWEFACRAGTETAFCFGDGKKVTSKNVNYNGNFPFGGASTSEYRERTVDVGSLPMNAFGLFEVHGNVWEWCQDDWHDNYEGAPDDGSAWESGATLYCIRRGGCWGRDALNCRSASRGYRSPGARLSGIGLRPARSLL